MKEETNHRYELLDSVRGIAIGLMLVYHLAFGLSYLDILKINFSTDLFWLGFRALIVFLFLSLVGVSLVLANRKKLNLVSYFKRLLLLFIYMMSISWLSYQIVPDRYVFFGILHLIFVSSILGLFFIRFYWGNLWLGVIVLLCGNFAAFEFFNHPLRQWIGLKTVALYTNDYAPLFPWFGVVLIGIFIGHLLMKNSSLQAILSWSSNHWLFSTATWAGRYSLHIYFIHFQLFYVLIYISKEYSFFML